MNNYSITNIKGRQILDSRGNPTVEADVYLSNNIFGRAAVPSGASTGAGEALELRDGGSAFSGKAVTKAVNNINTVIKDHLIGFDASNQSGLDNALIALDGTKNKSNLGANAILAISLAAAKAVAKAKNIPLHRYIAEMTDNIGKEVLPMPMMNIMNGGKHAAGSTDIQEYMIIPVGAETIGQAVQMGAEVFHALGKVLKNAGYATTVGDEGGYAPSVKNGNREPFELISEAIAAAGYKVGEDIALAFDTASSELLDDNNKYNLATEHRSITSQEMIDMYKQFCLEFPIISIEDGLSETDWESWAKLNAELGDKIQLVGDDLFVTNVELLEKGINEKSANAILIKPNQIGSLTETVNAVKMAQAAGWRTVMSHRSGETEDTTIAHLAVGLATGQIKTGSLSRTDRVAKYNELMRIAEESPEIKLAKPFSL